MVNAARWLLCNDTTVSSEENTEEFLSTQLSVLVDVGQGRVRCITLARTSCVQVGLLSQSHSTAGTKSGSKGPISWGVRAFTMYSIRFFNSERTLYINSVSTFVARHSNPATSPGNVG